MLASIKTIQIKEIEMNAKRRWYELLLAGMAVLLVLAAGTIQTANAEYVEGTPQHDHDKYESEEGPGEDVYATSNSNEYGELSCQVHVYCDADGVSGPTSTWGYAAGWGDYLIDWTWSGAPEDAPGGTLDWSQSGIGNAYAWGNNVINGGTAESYAEADSETHSYGTQASAYGTNWTWGFVIDNNRGVGLNRPQASPWDDFSYGTPVEREGNGWYSYGLGWQFNPDYEETIPEGTTYVFFSGGADCDSAASANASGIADSHANCDSYASVELYADFP